MKMRTAVLVFCCLAVGLARGQQGDRRGEVQPALPEHWITPPAPVLSPAEALKTFRLAEESHVIELFASEPMLQDPVAMEFDPAGRLWVVEMRGYMQDIDGRGERDPIGRVSVLEDTDRDGRADKATVFLDQLVLPRALKVCWGGALVAFNEQLWFARDTDGNGVADERELVDADYIQSGNPEHQPNGLLLGMDNWIYSAKSDQRYRRVGGKWLKEKTEFRGQWGITQDDSGRLYYNINYSQLHADLFPPNYSLRNTNFTAVHAINRQVATNQAIFTLRPNTGVNRGYRPGILDERGHLKEFTSASAPHVYRDTVLWTGDDFGPEQEVFVCEPAANLVKRNRVRWGAFEVGSEFAYPDREFLVSTDERFRPVWLATSPDGALYIADMYRGINQHRQYMTTHLRGEVLARELDKGIHLGRIWRVSNRAKPVRRMTPLAPGDPATLLDELNAVSGVRRDHAQQLIVESGDRSLVPQLLEKAGALRSPTGRMQALWALEGLLAQATDGGVRYQPLAAGDWNRLLSLIDDSPLAGVTTMRVAGLLAKGDPGLESELIARITTAGLTKPSAAFALVPAALVAGDLGCDDAMGVMLTILDRQPQEPLIREAVLSGLGGRELPALRSLLGRWTTFQPDRDVVLQQLAACVARSGSADDISRLLGWAADQRDAQVWRQLPLLSGILQHRLALKRNPPALAGEPVELLALRETADPLTKAAVDSIVTCIEWPGHRVERVTRRPLRPLTGSFAQQFAEGRIDYQRACASCHGISGEGLPSLAPPLVDSEWVSGPLDRLLKIVLHGLEGPIDVNGKTYGAPEVLPNMPAVATLSDREIAGILVFIRREMAFRATTLSADEVLVFRSRFADRQEPWTAAELLAAPVIEIESPFP